MIGFQEVLDIHQILIERFGGTSGLRDSNALKAALSRPYATFGKQELYPTPTEKASAILESIVTNHPFIDGNKRTGYVLMQLMLMENNLDIAATEEDKYQFMISISKGLMNFDKITVWIKSRLVENHSP